jgi:hypothetical protein
MPGAGLTIRADTSLVISRSTPAGVFRLTPQTSLGLPCRATAAIAARRRSLAGPDERLHARPGGDMTRSRWAPRAVQLSRPPGARFPYYIARASKSGSPKPRPVRAISGIYLLAHVSMLRSCYPVATEAD